MSHPTQPPLIRLPLSAQQSPVTTDPELNVNFPKGSVFYISVHVEDTSQGAHVTFRGLENALNGVRIGAELGTTRILAPFTVRTINLSTGAAGGSISAWPADSGAFEIDPC